MTGRGVTICSAATALIENLRPANGANVLEIGCGTGRNLVQAARLYPNAQLFGIDVSTEMLTSAIASISRPGLVGRIRSRMAMRPRPSRSYCSRSRIRSCDDFLQPVDDPDWSRVIESASINLKPGGRLHIVDFGKQERLPGIARVLLAMASMFDVTPRDDLERVLSGIAETCGADLKFERPFRGYAQYAVLTLPRARAPVSGWLALLGAGLLEMAWALGLKYSDGLTRFWPSALTLIAIALSFTLMALALRSLPFGTAYAVWTGIGAAGSIIVGMLIFSEPTDPVRILCLTLIVAGMVGLKLNSPI